MLTGKHLKLTGQHFRTAVESRWRTSFQTVLGSIGHFWNRWTGQKMLTSQHLKCWLQSQHFYMLTFREAFFGISMSSTNSHVRLVNISNVDFVGSTFKNRIFLDRFLFLLLYISKILLGNWYVSMILQQFKNVDWSTFFEVDQSTFSWKPPGLSSTVGDIYSM